MRPSKRIKWIFAICFTVVCLTNILSTVALFVASNRVSKNRQAIEVSCTLLANAINEATTVKPLKGSTSDLGSQLTSIYVQAIMRSMTKKEVQRTKDLTQQITKKGGVITVPNCSKIVSHPENVKAIPPGE